MITKFAPKSFEETRDSLSWALAYAPDFKGEQTLEDTFDDLVHGVNVVKGKTRSPEKLAIIEQVLNKLAVSKAAFVAGQMKPAHQALFDAGQLFRNLRS